MSLCARVKSGTTHIAAAVHGPEVLPGCVNIDIVESLIKYARSVRRTWDMQTFEGQTDTVGRLGTVAPLFCAIHCLLGPTFAAFAPALAHTPTIEYALMSLTTLIAAPPLLTGFRLHRCRTPILLAGAGLTCWALHVAGALRALPETPIVVTGSALLFLGLLTNRRLRTAR